MVVKLPFSSKLNAMLLSSCKIEKIKADSVIIREEQYVPFLPILLEGLVRVYNRMDGKEWLLYYITSHQSCIMTFSSIMKNEPSKIIAETETESELLLLPAHQLPNWLREYPELNELIYSQYHIRYMDMLTTIKQLVVDKLDVRVLRYIKQKCVYTGTPIKMSHLQLANEMGTAREVISRVLKKLELDGKIVQSIEGIKITGEM